MRPGLASSVARVRSVVDRHYILLSIPIVVSVMFLNYQATDQQDDWHRPNSHYLDLRDVIRGGFDPSLATRLGTPTFPMWGYSWLLLITDSKPALLVFQNALALLSVWCFVRALESTGVLNGRQLTVLKAAFILSVNWHAFHSVPGPASVATSLLLLAFSLLPPAFLAAKTSTVALVGSGLLMGVAANFRAEALLLPAMLGLPIAFDGRFRLRVLARLACWWVCVPLTLVPWALYTRHVTGHALLTSTNGGLTSLTGFGHVPDNRWGITISDGDPFVYSQLRQRFGVLPTRTRPALLYEQDRFLKGEFIRLVRADPGEYARKILYTFVAHLTGGTYPGEFYNRLGQTKPEADRIYLSMQAAFKNSPLRFFADNGARSLLFSLQIYSSLLGRVIVLLSFVLMPIVLIYGVRRRLWLLLCAEASILYSALVLTLLANAVGRFSSPLYPFHLVNIIVGFSILAVALRRKHRPTSPNQEPRNERGNYYA